MIALVDYGAGNLASVRKALAAVGASVWTPAVPGELGRAHGIIVPGVGHFDATRALDADWRTAIETAIGWRAGASAARRAGASAEWRAGALAPATGVPLLGICVGLQWLFEGSDEAPGVPGLGLLKGTCFPFTPNVSERRKVPHVGWNSLTITRPSRLMTGVKNGAQVYFTHSYAAPLCDDTVATCDYGGAFTAAAERGHISAVQFHPEKSGDAGLRILSNWINAL